MNDPNLTLPPVFTDPKFERFIANKLDEHFAPKALELSMHYLRLVKICLERDLPLLAWDYARAAAHWKSVNEDHIVGCELIEAE